MADMELQTVIDFIVEAGKVKNTEKFEQDMQNILGALVQKMDAPAAMLNVPIELEKINPAQVEKIGKDVAAQIKNVRKQLSKVVGKTDEASQLKTQGLKTAEDFLQGIQSALKKAPSIKIDDKVKADLQAVLQDPLSINKILKENDGAKRLQAVRAYAQHIDDMRSEIARIHKRASAGTRLSVGAGESFRFIETLKFSLPDMGVVSKLMDQQLAQVRRATSQANALKTARKEVIDSLTSQAERSFLSKQFQSIPGSSKKDFDLEDIYNLKAATADKFDFRGVEDILTANVAGLKKKVKTERAQGIPPEDTERQLQTLRGLLRDVKRRRAEVEGNSLALGYDKHLENAKYAADKALEVYPVGAKYQDLSDADKRQLGSRLSKASSAAENALRLAGDERKEQDAQALIDKVKGLYNRRAADKESVQKAKQELDELQKSSDGAFKARKANAIFLEKQAKQELDELQKRSNETFRIRKNVRAFEERQARQRLKQEQLGEQLAGQQTQFNFGKQAYKRVRGDVLSLADHEQKPVQDYLKEMTRPGGRNEQKIAHLSGLLDQAVIAGDTAAVQKYTAAIHDVNRVHRQQKDHLSLVNREMTGNVGLLHQAALATQQFLRYAILYGSGFKALQGIGALFGGTLDLDKQLHAIKAITQASDEAMAAVEASIKGVASSTQFGTSEISQAAQVLAQAGVELDKLPGILSVTAKLASTTGSDLKATADVITSLVEVFRPNDSSVAGVTSLADQVAQAVNISKLSTEGMKTIISLGASTAQTSGLKSEQFFGAAATLSNKGIKDSTIATGLRETMLELFNPDDKMLKYLSSRYSALGETVSEAFIKARFQAFQNTDNPMVAALTELKRIGVSGAGRNDFNRVTDIRAQNILLPLIESLDQLNQNTAKIAQSGATARGAATQMEAFNNAMTGLGSTLVSLTHEVVEGMLPPLTGAVNSIKGLVERLRQYAAGAEGQQEGSVVNSTVTGLAAGALTFAKTSGGKLKRLAAGGLAAVGVGGADTVAHSEGGALNTAANVGEFGVSVVTGALILKKLSSVFSKAGELTGPIVRLTESIPLVGRLVGGAAALFTAPAWVEIAALIATVYGGVQALKGVFGTEKTATVESNFQAAITSQAEARRARDETAAAFAPYNKDTAGGQAEAVAKADATAQAARAKVQEILGNNSGGVLDLVTELGTKGLEAGSKAQKEILDKIRTQYQEVPDAKIKELTEAGAKLGEARDQLLGKSLQQITEIKAAFEAANPSAEQQAVKEAYLSLSKEQRELLTNFASAKSADDFGKLQAALSGFYFLVLNKMPKDAEERVKAKDKEMAKAFLSKAELDNDHLQAAILSIKEKASQGAIEELEAISDAIYEAYQNSSNRAAIEEVSKQVNKAIQAARDVKTATSQTDEGKKVAAEENTRRLALEEKFGTKKEQASDAATNLDVSTAGREKELEIEIQKLTKLKKFDEAAPLSIELDNIKAEKAKADLASKVVEFERQYLLHPAKNIVEDATNGVQHLSDTQTPEDRAKLYTTDQDFRDAVLQGSEELKKAFLEMTGAATTVFSEIPASSNARVEELQQASTSKSLGAQAEVLGYEIDDIKKRIETAKTSGTFEAQYEQLTTELLAARKKEIAIWEKQQLNNSEDPELVSAGTKNRLKLAEDEAEKLRQEAQKRAYSEQRKDYKYQISNKDKEIGFAATAGDLEKVKTLQSRRSELLKKLEEVEQRILENEQGTLSEVDKQRRLHEVATLDLEKQADEQLKVLSARQKQADTTHELNTRVTPFTPVEQSRRAELGIPLTREQEALTARFNLYNETAYQENLQKQRTTAVQQMNFFESKGDVSGVERFRTEIEQLDTKLKESRRTVDEYRNQIFELDATFMSQIQALSSDGVLAKFEQLNPGFSHLKDQIEGNLADTFDGLTDIIGSFVAHGFTAVQDIGALRDAMMNVYQAEQNYQSVKSNRIGYLAEIQASPTIMKEDPAVRALIIDQGLTAQKAAESAAKAQVLIAEMQQQQTIRENSLGGQLSKFSVDQMKELGTTLFKDTLGEGIRGLFGLGKDKASYAADGGLKAHITNLPSGGLGGQSKEQGAQDTGGSWLSNAWDSVTSWAGDTWNSLTGDAPSQQVDSLGTSAKDTTNKFDTLTTSTVTLTEAANTAADALGGIGSGGGGGRGGAGSILESVMGIGSTVMQGVSDIGKLWNSGSSNNTPNTAGFQGNGPLQSYENTFQGNGPLQSYQNSAGNTDGYFRGDGPLQSYQNTQQEAAANNGPSAGKDGASIAGAAASIIGSLWSIYNTVSAYEKSVDLEKKILAMMPNHQGSTPPKVDPTLDNTSATTDTNYKALAGYLTSDKYSVLFKEAVTAAASGAATAVAASPASYASRRGQAGIAVRDASTGVQQLAQSQQQSQQNQQQPQHPGVRIINVVDQSMVQDFMSSAAGEKVILNTVRRNATTVKEYIR